MATIDISPVNDANGLNEDEGTIISRSHESHSSSPTFVKSIEHKAEHGNYMKGKDRARLRRLLIQLQATLPVSPLPDVYDIQDKQKARSPKGLYRRANPQKFVSTPSSFKLPFSDNGIDLERFPKSAFENPLPRDKDTGRKRSSLKNRGRERPESSLELISRSTEKTGLRKFNTSPELSALATRKTRTKNSRNTRSERLSAA